MAKLPTNMSDVFVKRAARSNLMALPVVAVALTLTGCATLPSSGPTGGQIRKSLTQSLVDGRIDLIEMKALYFNRENQGRDIRVEEGCVSEPRSGNISWMGGRNNLSGLSHTIDGSSQPVVGVWRFVLTAWGRYREHLLPCKPMKGLLTES